MVVILSARKNIHRIIAGGIGIDLLFHWSKQLKVYIYDNIYDFINTNTTYILID